MTFPELQRLVESITFCGGLKAWGAELKCAAAPAGVGVAFYLTQLPNRDTDLLDGLAGTTVAQISTETLAAMDRQAALQWIRRVAVSALVLHELDESILYRGARVFDPHRPEALDSAMRRADEAADRREADEAAFRWAFSPRELFGREVHSIIVDELT